MHGWPAVILFLVVVALLLLVRRVRKTVEELTSIQSLYFQININHFGLNRSIFFFQKLAMIKFKIIEKAE